MVLDEKTRELIAVGASFTAHCEPCLTAHTKKAVAAGACADAVAEAIEVARLVRSGAAAALDRFAARWSRGSASPTDGCGCGASPGTAEGGCA